jgi:hypothetical protein
LTTYTLPRNSLSLSLSLSLVLSSYFEFYMWT